MFNTNDKDLSQAPEIREESLGKIERLLKVIKAGMLTTINSKQELCSRPMILQQFDLQAGELWFFTGRQTGKVFDIEKDSRVNIAFASPGSSSFVSVYGAAEIVDDKQKEKELWNPALLAWFPEGLKDPNLVLLCVKINSVEYWDSSSTFVQIVGFTKALLTGETYKPSLSEHGRVNLNM
ncbi:MAG: pyridoxamine 5'-phosphate oxidase family protein [Bdellovibrio sp.]|nr:pyridoxamine 5'-phosphate oxidase family protein [Bdellovibrio sp.]